MKTIVSKALLALLMTLGVSAPVVAQDNAQDEEVIVIDDLTKAEVQAYIEEVETQFWQVFNANTDERHLKVNCGTTTPTMSHITQRVCEPVFVVDARNENARKYRDGTDVLLSAEDLQKGLQAEFAELTAEMNRVLKENATFRELNGILRMLRARLAELEQ
ncbi:MAG: hypothetical protein RLZZ385_810 [Pseudomonadota bacterium]